MPPFARARLWLGTPLDASGFVVFRVLFGLLLAVIPARLVVNDWVGPLFVEPGFRFAYTGFEWVPRPSEPVLLGLLAVQLVAGVCLAAGFRSRLAALVYFVAFTWIELIDQATYLNHYYLLSLMTGLLGLLPIHRSATGAKTIPRWALLWLQAQVATVYVFAGIAKLGSDWLLRGEPLHIWLSGMTHLPGIGPLMDQPSLALAMSWAGCGYDLLICGFLLHRPTRAAAWVTVVVFHSLTWLLFPIGVFPWVMIACSTLFFEPDWPRRWTRRPAPRLPIASPAPLPALLALTAWMTVQLALPLRGLVQPGQLNWTERGFRFSWRVMVIEKTGLVDFRVVDSASGRVWVVHPADHLSRVQHRLMRTQPDMIAQFARHLAQEWHTREGAQVAVYADAFCSLNGRPSQRLIDPRVDLSRPEAELPAHWIVPLQDTP